MPESEAKKKAYEYMRKKMGLTADNPFTEANGNTNSFLYAQKLQVALNESAGYEKYKVSARTDNALLNQIEVVVTENIPGVCAEPKAATVAHYNKTRYYTTKKVPHGHDGSNQMDACDTCKKNMEVYIRYAKNK